MRGDWEKNSDGAYEDVRSRGAERRERSGARLFVLGILLCLVLPIWCGLRCYQHVRFGIDFEGRLERAASANTVAVALPEVATAVAWLEAHDATSGYTSIFYNTPDEDVGFFYTNMRASLAELHRVPPDASPLEQSNVLMKLRETVEHVPKGLDVFPGNTTWCVAGWIAFVAFGLGITGIIAGGVRRWNW